MVLFNCTTCSSQLEDAEMLKHLSQTRHKTLVHVPSQSTLECDSCQDTNIHQLVIIRYGGSDIEMLCQPCLAKDSGDKPSTQYTEQNGAILKYYERYLKVAELECGLCGSETNLSIDINNTRFVACLKCIKQGDLETDHKFLRESADNFLYVFLGIKETVKPSDKVVSRSRKIGRGKGGRKSRAKGGRSGAGSDRSGSSTPRPGKPSATSKVIIPTENIESLRTFKSLSTAQLAKIKPQDEVKVIQQRKIDTSKSSNNTTKSSTPSKSSPSSKSGNRKSNSNSSKTARHPKPSSSQQQKLTSNSKDSSNSKKSIPVKSPNPFSPEKKSIKELLTKPDNVSKENNQKKPESKISKNKKTGNNTATSTISTDFVKLKPKPKEKASKKQIINDKIATNTSKGFEGSNKKIDAIKEKTEKRKVSAKDNNNKSKPDKNVSSISKTNINQKPIIVNKIEEEVEEYEHIPKYQSKQPKLRYDNMNQYFIEMCSHLFLEQKLDVTPITKYYPDWTTDRSVFKITIPNDEDIQKLVPENLRALGKSPFQVNQGIFITRDGDNDHVWSAFIRDMAPITKHKRSKTVIEYDILLELFKWNEIMSFPYGSGNLRITPCSVPISRILLAMARLENKSFISMLLGQTKIKQISFNNRLQFSSENLNQSQKVAIEHVLNNSITVLQGPPGTGKTSTIYEIIIQLIKNLHTFPIMVVAASNVAVDNIAEKLKFHTDLKTLRITSQEKEKEYNESHPLADICLHHQVESHLPQNIKDIGKSLRRGEKISANAYKKYLTAKISTVDRLVAQAQIILTTTVAAGGLALKNVSKVPVVIMDEATQSNEASSLIPLSIPGVTKFLFVGDQKQLSSFSDVPYLEQSLFERVLLNGTYTTPHMLDTQYRMHPDISMFPINEFYEGKLKDGVTAEQKTIIGVEPLCFINHEGKFQESRVRNRGFNNGATYINHGEASLIVKLIKKLHFVKNVNLDQISIITPYSAQRDLLAQSIQSDLDLNPLQEPIAEEIDDESGLTRKRPSTVKTIRGIMVSSIDAYQGREQDIVIFSCVRSNGQANIGFVRDRRRLNVALTRAKKALYLIGDKDCLQKGDSLWEKYMKYLEEKEMISTEKFVEIEA